MPAARTIVSRAPLLLSCTFWFWTQWSSGDQRQMGEYPPRQCWAPGCHPAQSARQVQIKDSTTDTDTTLLVGSFNFLSLRCLWKHQRNHHLK